MDIYFKNYINLSQYEKELILAIRNSEFIRQNMYDSTIIELKDHLSWINNLKNKINCKYWAIFVDKELIGCIDLTDINLSDKFAEWGFYLDKRHTGIGALIEYLGMEHFIFDLNFEKILACVYENNKRVYNMHKNKFNYIDASEYSFNKDGKQYNGLILTKENWKIKREIIENLLNKIYKINEVSWEK